ncbi:hypothetical protein O181_129806 [Austropuccinia psidii MF-1]|uniref:Uncharacterized protein n=1 Tax=Austropuccinia psidii MF-1 TaxID=1389203 RepID=A0A9Q3Q8W9_9BASI|nr:hypothetical protein [Austropuccinia psidii MF-1]
MKEKLIYLFYKYKSLYATEKEVLGAITGHEVDIMINSDKPYPPLLRRPAYPDLPNSREDLEVHIKELMDRGALKKVELNTPVIITWHNGKSGLVGFFRALNTYTCPDR